MDAEGVGWGDWDKVEEVKLVGVFCHGSFCLQGLISVGGFRVDSLMFPLVWG